MAKHCTIMQRMKNYYEAATRYFLTRRVPVIIRIDGKAFHTYTKGLQTPFDADFIEDMNQTAIFLCENIQGAKCAHVHSDEISILVTDYDTTLTDAWFGYNLQKMCSISASLATSKFNYLRISRDYCYDDSNVKVVYVDNFNPANFDSRVFNVPREDVANYFLARQKDAVKNSIASVARSLWSDKELEHKNQSKQQEMIFAKGLNWNNFPDGQKRGRFIKKICYVDNKKLDAGTTVSEASVIRNKWRIVEPTGLNYCFDDFAEFLK